MDINNHEHTCYYKHDKHMDVSICFGCLCYQASNKVDIKEGW